MSKPADSSRLRLLFLSLSLVSLVLCVLGATAHYLKSAWGGTPMFIMSRHDLWSHNRKAIVNYALSGKDLKLIWETGGPGTESIIRMFQSFLDLGTEHSLSFSFGGRVRTFYVLNIANKNIRQFQERVRALPDIPF